MGVVVFAADQLVEPARLEQDFRPFVIQETGSTAGLYFRHCPNSSHLALQPERHAFEIGISKSPASAGKFHDPSPLPPSIADRSHLR